jgi:hypothetical protein
MFGASFLTVTVGCGPASPPSVRDVPADAVQAFPGATKQYEHWTPEERGREIDTNSPADVNAQLKLKFALEEPVELAVVVDWHRDKLETLAFARCPHENPFPGYVVVACKTRNRRRQKVALLFAYPNPIDVNSLPNSMVDTYSLVYNFEG